MRRLLVTCLSLLMLIANVSYAHAKPLNIPVVYYKLPNGLKVVISEDHIAPVVTVAVYYSVGFRVEPKGRTGFAHLFEHMMFQGSANVKKFEHAKFVEANGGSLNGHTDFDYTNYYQTLPEQSRGAWALAGIRPHAFARHQRRELEEPASRRQRGSSRERPESPLPVL